MQIKDSAGVAWQVFHPRAKSLGPTADFRRQGNGSASSPIENMLPKESILRDGINSAKRRLRKFGRYQTDNWNYHRISCITTGMIAPIKSSVEHAR